MRKLTVKQRAFADYYIKYGNATKAAKEAGYSKKTARFIGNENLTKPNIKKYIDKRLEEIASERIADATEVMEYLTKVIRGESKSEIVVVESIEKGVSEARNIQKAPDERERLKAAELIGKRYGIYTDKVEHSGALAVYFEGEDDLED